MDSRAVDIDAIVDEVLRRLRAQQSPAVRQHPASQSAGDPSPPSPAVPPTDELRIKGPVVGLSELTQGLAAGNGHRLPTSATPATLRPSGAPWPEGVRQVTVCPGAVVTPAVRDLLRQQKIRLVVGAIRSGSEEGSIRLIAGWAAPADRAHPLRVALEQDVGAKRLMGDGLVETVAELAVALRRREGLGLLLAENVLAALCLANRQRGVRAVEVRDAADVRRAGDQVGANLLVIDSRHTRRDALLAIARAYQRGGFRPCPEPWRRVLD